MNYQIRPIQLAEIPLLSDFLYEAIFIPEGVEAPPRSIIEDESLQIYIRDFGKFPDDRCLVAESNGRIVGAIRMYQKAGFQILSQDAEEAIMLCPLK